MTVAELEERLTSEELTEWGLYFKIEQERTKHKGSE